VTVVDFVKSHFGDLSRRRRGRSVLCCHAQMKQQLVKVARFAGAFEIKLVYSRSDLAANTDYRYGPPKMGG